MPKVLSKHHHKAGLPEGAVYVGRPTKFGNPFKVEKPSDRGQAVLKFKEWIYTQPQLIEAIQRELRGKDLVCWCAPRACHADILLEIANPKETAMPDPIATQIKELTDKIRQYNKEYYDLNTPTVSDAVYDDLYNQLLNLENTYPQYKQPDSPTNKVGGQPSKGFRTAKHSVPMLSIQTETNPSKESLAKWIKSLEDKLAEPVRVMAEFKFDGLGLSATYHKGKLVQALTRGDGETGEDVTANAQYIAGLPTTIPDTEDILEVRGEVLITKEDFKALQQQAQQRGDKPFANARNAAAGGLRQLDPLKTKERRLTFYAYSLVRSRWLKDPDIRQSDILGILNGYGINVYPATTLYIDGYKSSVDTYEQPYDTFEEMGQLRDSIPFEFDGVVFKVDSIAQQRQLGFRGKDPYWAIAYKFPPQERTTKLLSIDIQIGRTGKVTPVARLEPVSVGGTTITNVTLHNVFDLRNRKVRSGDTVIVRRAGDVIPEISGYIPQDRHHYLPNFHVPTHCPSCSAPLKRYKSEKEYYCLNHFSCPAQLVGSILHYADRRGMDIKGLGDSIASILVQSQLVKTISDIYTLNKDKLTSLGLGDKTADNILASIQTSSTRPLKNFIQALGIPFVGEGTSLRLSKRYTALGDILDSTMEDLLTIDDIGETTAKSIYDFTSDQANVKEILRIMELGNIKLTNETTTPKEGPLTGQTYVISGELTILKKNFGNKARSWLESKLVSLGANVGESVNKATTCLIIGESPSSKLAKAEKLGVLVLSEKDMLTRLELV